MDNLIYYLFLLLVFFIKKIPKFIKNGLKKVLVFLFYNIATKRRKIVSKNIELMLGKKDKNIEKQTFEYFIDNLFELIENMNISKDQLSNMIEFKNEEKVKEILKKSPVIFVTAHYGNWEIMPTAVAAFLTPTDIVVRRLDNQKLNDLLEKNRKKFGVGVYDKRGGLRSLLKSLKEHRSIGILTDQYPGDDKGVETTFFGHKVRHTEVAAILSKKFNIPIVMIFVDKKDEKYIIEFVDIFYTKDTQSSVDRQAKVTQEYIKSHGIEKWYLFHRRFRPLERYE